MINRDNQNIIHHKSQNADVAFLLRKEVVFTLGKLCLGDAASEFSFDTTCLATHVLSHITNVSWRYT